MDCDTEIFINEIERRPILWDSSCEEYSNRQIKKQVWREMVDIFEGSELLSETEKNELELNLRKKWKHIRCCFVREIRRRKNPNGSSLASRKNPYIYFNHLLFLNQAPANPRPAEESFEVDDADIPPPFVHPKRNKRGRPRKSKITENVDKGYATANTRLNEMNLEVDESDFKCPFKPKRTKPGPKEIHLTENVEKENKHIHNRDDPHDNPECDEDRMFLLSLLSSFRKIPEHRKLPAKIELMKLIVKAQGMKTC